MALYNSEIMVGELEVSVMDGDVLVQTWVCTLTVTPGGAPAALWRGVAYPVLPGNRIDIGTQQWEAPPLRRHAVITGDDSSWVLTQGLPTDLEAARKALSDAGMQVSRAGRWLGEAIDDIGFDWFIRCDGRVERNDVDELLGSSHPVPVEDRSAGRLSVLELRIAALQADLARAEVALRAASNPSPMVTAADIETGSALELAIEEIKALQAALEASRPQEITESSRSLNDPRSLRSSDEVAALLATIRPDITLLRDSLVVAFGDYESRHGFYKALADLPLSGGRPDGWKRLRGADWWEEHVSTGRNDHGRAYARFDTRSRHWSFLLSWKADQARDIAWLNGQP